METITAQEFKTRIRVNGTINNVKVVEPISYYLADHGNTPPIMVIKNCELSEFMIAKLQITSLSFVGGKMKKLMIETESGVQDVKIDKVDVAEVDLVETVIGNLDFKPKNRKPSLTGRMATVQNTTLTGEFKLIRILRFEGQSLTIRNCSVKSIEFNDLGMQEVQMQNVECKDTFLGFESRRPNKISATNVDGNLKAVYERTREISVAKPIKSFIFNVAPSQ